MNLGSSARPCTASSLILFNKTDIKIRWRAASGLLGTVFAQYCLQTIQRRMYEVTSWALGLVSDIGLQFCSEQTSSGEAGTSSY